jgi:hypothetical protein
MEWVLAVHKRRTHRVARRELIALAGACALHAVVVGVVHHRAVPLVVAASAPVEVVEISVEAAPELREDAPLGPAEEGLTAAPARALSHATSATPAEPGEAREREAAAAAGAERGGAISEWSFSPIDLRKTAPDLLRAAPERWSLSVPDEGAPKAASTSGGVVEALDTIDAARGLGRGGPMRAAVEQAARSGDAPVRGTATFTVVLFSDGKVDVRVADEQADWSRLIPVVRDALRSANVRLPPSARGLRVTVAVKATVQYPDGYQPPDEAHVSARVRDGLPALDVEYHGRRCAAAATIAPGGAALGGGCSAGTPLRLVSTRIVAEERL